MMGGGPAADSQLEQSPSADRIGYLGLGSNVGNRLRHLAEAVAMLPRRGVRVMACSGVYETEPVGLVLEQQDFLNVCVRVQTGLGPEQLLDVCKAVERDLGRASGGARHGPREIDIDMLLLGSIELRTVRLVLPHPEILTRRFVLVPLLELDPGLRLPSGERAADALAQLGSGQAVRRAGEPLL